MNKDEEIAEKVMRLAYNNNGTASDMQIKELLTKEEYDIYSDSYSMASKILDEYGSFINLSLDESDFLYTLNNKGHKYANSGCYSGEEERNRKTNKNDLITRGISIVALILSAIAIIAHICK
jgi:hypothetical protein